MNRPDTSVLDAWADPEAIESAATKIRSDGAKYAKIARGVQPVWRDLRIHFRLWGTDDYKLFQAGRVISDYAKAIHDGADNVASALDECASTLRQYETRRKDLITRAEAARTQAINNPAPTLSADGTLPDDYFSAQQLHESAQSNIATLESEIAEMASRYRELMASTAREIDGVNDDGGASQPFLGLLFDAALIAVAVFIPPVAGAALVVGAAKGYDTEYRNRMWQLQSEHPELSDSEMRKDAAGRAAVTGTMGAFLPFGAGKVGGVIINRAVDNEVTRRAAGQVAGWGAAAVGSQAVSGWPGIAPAKANGVPDRPTFAPPNSSRPRIAGPWTPEARQAKEEQAARINDPKRVRDTKDYDRDGYTDPQFRPDTKWVLPPERWGDTPGGPEQSPEGPTKLAVPTYTNDDPRHPFKTKEP